MPETITSSEVRLRLVDALRLDLVGPSTNLGDAAEVLPQAPSRWYLTGFLVPIEGGHAQKADEQSEDELDEGGEGGGLDDDVVPEPAAARQRYLPSSIGLSVIVPAEATQLKVDVLWGDYRLRTEGRETWDRTPRTASVTINLTKATEQAREIDVPDSDGLRVAYLARRIGAVAAEAGFPPDARTVSVFLANRRTPAPDERKDEAFAFQVELAVSGDAAFLPRPDLRSLASDDWDECVADLQYRDVGECAVGHNVATHAVMDDGVCRLVRTCWIPDANVEYVDWRKIEGAEMSMDVLSRIQDFSDAKAKLSALVTEYRAWIGAQQANVPATPAKRQATGRELLQRAQVAANRIQRGIDLLNDPVCLEAFRLTNKVMAEAARRRLNIKDPIWRPFQLAFLLMNLAAIADPKDTDREVVDLLFFPTGGGKTEAYLGLAAFTLLVRRLKNPGIGSAGVSVLMRYTLRLLTLDQLGRAATLICAMELERRNDVSKLGDWPFEIGLWVGRAATLNRMGEEGDNDPNTARLRTLQFRNDDRRPSPIPLEVCPWCGTKFKNISFRLLPNSDHPKDLRISCVNRDCQFSRGVPLPILSVDEPIYRRLPCFVIATVDKFAALPWTGQVGGFFGRVQRYDQDGFYGPCDSPQGAKLAEGRLPPPDLIIQDELHLISGPLSREKR